jgi:hypothetical protein
MQRVNRRWLKCALLAVVLLIAPEAAPRARAAGQDGGSGPESAAVLTADNRSATAPAPAAAAGGVTPATVEEQLQQQTVLLRQMQEMLVKQQGEIERLRSEVDSMRGAAGPGAVTAATTVTRPEAVAADRTTTATDPATAKQDGSEEIQKRVDELTKRWGKLRLSGDLRFRSESFINQGFDAPVDVNARNRFRMRVRAQLTGEVNKYFDWGLRLATGSFDDPISTNQTLDNFYDRKPFAVDRMFVHFNTRTKPAEFEVYAGKFDYTWKRTPATFDNDLQPEGLSESVKFGLDDDSPLRSVKFTAWQLPFKERSVGADAYIFGGQILTDWKWSDNWSTSLSGTFHDFEQVYIIPQFVNVSPTLVNAGFDYATTNTVVINPFTNLPEYRSEFRAIDLIAEVKYTGFGAAGSDSAWPLVLRAEWIRNTSAFNNQKDGGQAVAEFGRRVEQGDWFLGYELFKHEREAFPSVFMESDILQTNAINHRASVSYMFNKQVELDTQYIWSRRLQTTSSVNRWLNRLQVDIIYKF